MRLKLLLEQEHLIAYVVANLYNLVLVLELLATSVLENGLTLLVCALEFLAPLFMPLDIREEDQFLAVMAVDLDNL
jgi:hypothetical protein